MKRIYWFLLLTLVTALVLSACGGGSDKDTSATSTPESAPAQPTDTPEPEPAPVEPTEPVPDQPTETPQDSSAPIGGEAGGAISDLLNLTEIKPNLKDLGGIPLQSYRVSAGWMVEAKQGSTAQSIVMKINAAYVSDPLAEEVEFYNDQVGTSTKIIRIGDQMWLQTGDRWIQVSSDEMSVDEVLFSFESAVPSLDGDAQLVDQQDLNGIATRRYAFDETILGLAGIGSFSQIKGEVWVAVEGNYVVKYVYSAEDDEATYSWSWELFDINAPITIEPPTDVQGARDDIPLMPDATERATVGALTTFQTASDLTTATDFYKTEMAAQGWTYDEVSSMVTAQFTVLNFVKEDAQANVTLALNEETGGTSVVIQVTEGE